MKQIFDWIANDKIMHLKSHRSAILFQCSNCYLGISHRIILSATENQIAKQVELKVQYLVIWHSNEICFIRISDGCLKSRTSFLLISENVIYTNEADFRLDSK